MSEEEIAESIKTKLQAVLKDPSALNRRKACDLICEAIHAITLLQFCLRTSKEQIRKETAKEIIQLMKRVQAMFYDKEYVAIQNLIAEKYGVEIEE